MAPAAEPQWITIRYAVRTKVRRTYRLRVVWTDLRRGFGRQTSRSDRVGEGREQAYHRKGWPQRPGPREKVWQSGPLSYIIKIFTESLLHDVSQARSFALLDPLTSKFTNFPRIIKGRNWSGGPEREPLIAWRFKPEVSFVRFNYSSHPCRGERG